MDKTPYLLFLILFGFALSSSPLYGSKTHRTFIGSLSHHSSISKSNTLLSNFPDNYTDRSRLGFSQTTSVPVYTLKFDTLTPKKIQIEAQITLQDSLLKMSNNGPLPYRWPQYIKNLLVYDNNSRPVKIEKRDSTAWIVDTPLKGQQVTIRYDVLLEHENQNWPGGIDGVAFVRDWGIMVSGRSLFVINGDLETTIQVEFNKPDHWKVSTPWKNSNKSAAAYTVPNHIQLLESLLFVGTHDEVEIHRDDFSLKFVLGGDLIVNNKGQYAEAANKILDYYIDLMGGIPKPAPGNNLSQVLVMINQSKEIDGEVIGNHISLFLNPEAAPQEQIIGWFLFAHEFFHLWNGKSLRFSDTQSDWFKEGVTNYYTIKALYHAKLVNEGAIKEVLNHLFYNRYINDSGYGTLAPSDAASGFDKDNHWGLVYGGGLFAGICMDMEIRNNTNNANSLDDLMRFFYDQFGGTDALISNDDILIQANQLGDTNFQQFMNTYIKGTQAVPLKKYMDYAGIQVDTNNKQLKLTHNSDQTEFQRQVWLGFLGLN